ncbi:hypothetical protein CEUSTIGMA_g4173.t1 [Chlamydomonas eustigma]|uniref:Uncharacterized protein n=1 Tax=Chlamydomonas eustigma TaxID=1157962 RepID=A0A250X101_9CHLO|nr:hypothetical protein CEUSTIGMA_g4173.t1 [Chlamydomonas eustigma]|eukprot:GAX76726.1 hypothetical protein CEUSTIGMA_g4173.t1 [Chlamydomonas eustigma]
MLSLCRVDITLIGNCTPFTNPITVAFNVIAGNTWYLDLQPKGCNGSWTPPWELPLLVLLPFICLALSLFVLTHQVEHSRHVRLLSSLVPKDSFPIDNSVANGSGRNSQQDNSGEMAFPSSQQRRLESLLTHTPADRILTVVGQLLKGSMPEIEDVMAIRRAIEERRDLYAAPRGLQDRMERHLASDVASYMTLLTINNRKQTLPKTDPKPSKEDCHELVCVLSSGALERHELSVLQMIAETLV